MMSMNQTGKIPDENVKWPLMVNWDGLYPKRSDTAWASRMLAGISRQAIIIRPAL